MAYDYGREIAKIQVVKRFFIFTNLSIFNYILRRRLCLHHSTVPDISNSNILNHLYANVLHAGKRPKFFPMSLIKSINAAPAARRSILHNAHLRERLNNRLIRRRSWI